MLHLKASMLKIVMVALFSCLIVGLLSCSPQPASQSPTIAPDTNPATLPEFDEGVKLLERANAWGQLLISMPTVNQAEALNSIRGFLEPSAASDQNVQKIYDGWNTQEYTIIGFSVEMLQINADHQSATIRYKTVIKTSAGRENTLLQYTDWILKNGIWYKTMEISSLPG